MRKVRLVLIAQLVDVQTKPLESNSFFRRAVASMKSKMLSNCCGLGVRVVWKNCSILRPLFRSPRSELCRPGSAPPASSSSTRSTPSGRSAARPALLLLLLSLLPLLLLVVVVVVVVVVLLLLLLLIVLLLAGGSTCGCGHSLNPLVARMQYYIG